MILFENPFEDGKTLHMPFKSDFIIALIHINNCDIVIGSSGIRMILSESYFLNIECT